MSKTLEQIAQQLGTPQTKKVEAQKERVIENAVPKVQLIYAFNGTGKTRLSLALKKLISPKLQDVEDLFEVDDIFEVGETRKKFLYYNAFTEDLFYWDNDLAFNAEPKLKIQRNRFTDWLIRILKDQGAYENIITNFQRYTNDKITPRFNEEYKYKDKDDNGKEVEITVPAFSEVTFTIQGTENVTYEGQNVTHNGDNIVIDQRFENIKISKGEESNLIWSIFYTFLEEVISLRNESDSSNRAINDFDQLEYVFIDDPVSSLDDNHLIELAVSLAKLIKSSAYEGGEGLRFIITTHNPLFYNVLYNEFNNDFIGKKSDGSEGKIYKKEHSKKYILRKHADGTFQLIDSGVNDRPFSYHLFLLSELRKLQTIEQVEKYHFNFLRNILEKTATFLGYKQWNELLQKLPEEDRDVMIRMLNLYSHSAHSGEEMADFTSDNKEKFIKLIKDFSQIYNFAEMKEDGNAGTN